MLFRSPPSLQKEGSGDQFQKVAEMEAMGQRGERAHCSSGEETDAHEGESAKRSTHEVVDTRLTRSVGYSSTGKFSTIPDQTGEEKSDGSAAGRVRARVLILLAYLRR